ncbi:uncharacterized protein BJX67DRAFT_358456 [Aspergillus lucknowensis]|uniref:Uncharacterized protein n=1 Tax=Aspergillus lucknowensis TaxID=176173 RepID=A0ABR4LQG1_9EURO
MYAKWTREVCQTGGKERGRKGKGEGKEKVNKITKHQSDVNYPKDGDHPSRIGLSISIRHDNFPVLNTAASRPAHASRGIIAVPTTRRHEHSRLSHCLRKAANDLNLVVLEIPSDDVPGLVSVVVHDYEIEVVTVGSIPKTRQSRLPACFRVVCILADQRSESETIEMHTIPRVRILPIDTRAKSRLNPAQPLLIASTTPRLVSRSSGLPTKDNNG